LVFLFLPVELRDRVQGGLLEGRRQVVLAQQILESGDGIGVTLLGDVERAVGAVDLCRLVARQPARRREAVEALARAREILLVDAGLRLPESLEEAQPHRRRRPPARLVVSLRAAHAL